MKAVMNARGGVSLQTHLRRVRRKQYDHSDRDTRQFLRPTSFRSDVNPE
jgi:hypothetical protein